MPTFVLEEILAATQGKVMKKKQEKFTDVVTDTRKIAEGALFLALKGERFNGEDFAREAAVKGAAGVLVSDSCSEENLRGIEETVILVGDTLHAYQQIAHLWRKKFHIPVVAITGSNGKTTTKELVAAVLSARGPVLKTQGNFNNEIGLPLTLLGLREEHRAAVVEIGMRGLHQIEALAPVAEPTLGIVTNVGETHIELLGSIENIARAKSELVEAIPPGGTVILNGDNEYVAAMKDKAQKGVKVFSFGLEKGVDVRGEDIQTRDGATEFAVRYGNGRQEYLLPMVGRHNVYNALSAVATGIALGLSSEEIREGLSHAEAAKMRFQIEQKGDYRIVNDAYNASPMSMTAAISTLSELAKGRKVAVMGDMLELGETALQAHLHVGEELAEKGFTAVITLGKMGEKIAEGAEHGGILEVRRCGSHKEAAEALKEVLKPGDTVLVKGSRGMEMEKVIDLM